MHIFLFQKRARWNSVHTGQMLHPLGLLPKHIHLFWAGDGGVAAPVLSSAGGLYTPSLPGAGQNASAVPPGRRQPRDTWWAASVSRQARGAHPWREHNGMQPAGRRGQVQIILLIVQNGKQASQDKEGWRRSDWRISPLLFFPPFSPFKHRKFHFAIFHLTASISQGVWFWYTGIESFAFYSGVWIMEKYAHTPPPRRFSSPSHF